MIVLSAHADTNFTHHSILRRDGGYFGYLDNFAGVHTTLQALFSGKITGSHVRVGLTAHEETTMGGAIELCTQLSPNDVVVVVDVTGIIGDWDFTIEKCANSLCRDFVNSTLGGFSYRLFENSPDPIAAEDEVDVYREKCPWTFFLGIPCSGGDYNHEPVFCSERSITKASEAIIALCEAYPRYSAFQVK